MSDGHVALPEAMRETLGLRAGSRLELTVHRVLPSREELEAELVRAVESPETSVDQLKALARELQSCAVPSPRLMQKLEAIARAVMPPSRQRRLTRLLRRNEDGTITQQERQLLEALVREGQIRNIPRANAALVLKWLGTDLFPNLGVSQAAG